MDKANALAQLKDIHLPSPVGWWPLAPGWYVLGFLIFLFTIGVVYFIVKNQRNARPKLQALLLLAKYKQQYENNKNSQVASSQISELLRRVALVYYPREKVASLHGESWLEFLNQTSHDIDFKEVQFMLLELPFRPAESVNLEPLFSRVELWIKQRVKPCSN